MHRHLSHPRSRNTVLLALVFSASLLRAQPDGALSAAAAARLDSVVLAELAATRTPGAALAIVRGDHVVYAKGYGLASVETAQAVTPDALFRLGSTTKMMTSLAALSLAAKGVVNLDRPISEFAPRITAPRLRGVTLRQLLTHSAGLLDYTSMSGPHDDGALNAFVPTLTDTAFFTQPGDMFSYSNLGYSIAGYVLSEAAHKPYAEVMRDEVFRPLGMTHSTLRPLEAMTYTMVQGHDRADSGVRVIRPAPDDSRYWPAGSVFTSALEFARLATAMMNDGVVDGQQAIPAAVIGMWRTPMAMIRTEAKTPERAYAFGLEVRRQRGDTVFDHSGSRAGFGSMFRMIPSRKLAVVVLGNLTGIALRQTLDAAVGAVAPEFVAEAPPRATPAALDAKDATTLVGRYFNAPGSGIEIFIDGERVMLRRLSPTGAASTPAPVQRVGANAYAAGATRFITATGTDGHTQYVLTGLRAMRKTP